MRIELASDFGHELLGEGHAGTLPLTELRAWPARVGAGAFGFIEVRPGVVLCITDFLPVTDVQMIAGPGVGYFTCTYYLQGHVEATVEGIDKPINLKEGQRTVGFAAPGCASTGRFAEQRRNVVVSLCLTPHAAMELLPTPETCRVAAWHDAFANGRSLGEAPRPLNGLQRAAVNHLLTCPFAGTARALFFESKALELLAYEAADESGEARVSLSPDDEERIRRAAQILRMRLRQPPTLRALAREVAVNELKLKRGFHEVFGTTVFGYLRARRLEVARTLLMRGAVGVAEAAEHVGYRCPSRFASAFQQHFGATPSSVRLVHRGR